MILYYVADLFDDILKFGVNWVIYLLDAEGQKFTESSHTRSLKYAAVHLPLLSWKYI